MGAAAPAAARLLLTQAQALAIAFPAGIKVERKTAYLTAPQLAAARRAGRVAIDSAAWIYYVGRSSAGVSGTAYFDTHVVRTTPETFMAVVGPDGRLRFVELLSFSEPQDYQPPRRWLDLFLGKSAKDDLMVGRAIRNITGASLTSQALADGVRRVLAVHQVLQSQERGMP